MRSINNTWGFLIIACLLSNALRAQTISFTFDDGITYDRPGYTFETWNRMLLNKLQKANVKAMFFVRGKGLQNERGKQLLDGWNNAGHGIANHTFSHPNYSSSKVSIEQFKQEFLKNDSLIKDYSNFKKYFRFPYLKEGNTPEKVTAFRQFLKAQNYKNGYVTIDASDWYVDYRLLKRLRQKKFGDVQKYREFYLNHIWERAQFYESLAFKLTGRHIKHTLLLHHNLCSALFIDDLMAMFKKKGWKIVSPMEAFQDPIYSQTPQYAGESLIYALARDSAKYKHLIRYPAEDSQYEKAKMDKLGL
ncbi:hypothetical protein BKI52_28025 [marine bacterium AO1-C]|nr:hypothetical protein BKI52_28025 [marine bacterium AO1-C]